MTLIVGGTLTILLVGFLLRLSYTITKNLINGRTFHQMLLQELGKLRLDKMLSALGINKTAYIYQTRVGDIQQQMTDCTTCANTVECDDRLTEGKVDIDEIDFCTNKPELIQIKKNQSEKISIDS